MLKIRKELPLSRRRALRILCRPVALELYPPCSDLFSSTLLFITKKKAARNATRQLAETKETLSSMQACYSAKTLCTQENHLVNALFVFGRKPTKQDEAGAFQLTEYYSTLNVQETRFLQMNTARAKLEAYRESKKEKEKEQIEEEKPVEEYKPPPPEKQKAPSILWKLLNIDLFSWIPVHHYHALREKNPRATLTTTICLYIFLQYSAYSAGFGAVFFIFSAFVALFLNLGQKKQGEVSAYSVFNPGCERLPGQMTAEHFERDVIRRRI